jgi:DNA-directed RNA polymerase specialized sigma24 family protein
VWSTGARAAFEHEIDDHLDQLLPLATALTGAPDQAAALVGTALARAGRNRARRRSLTSPAEDLRRLVVVEYLRTRPRTAVSMSPSAAPTGTVRSTDPTAGTVRPTDPTAGTVRPTDPTAGTVRPTDPTASRAGAIRLDGLLAALDRLPGRLRAVVVLSHLSQLTQAEIGSVLDRSRTAVVRDFAGAGHLLARAVPGMDHAELAAALRHLAGQAPTVQAAHAELDRQSRAIGLRRRRAVLIGVAAVTVGAAVAVTPTVVVPRLPMFIRQPGQWTFMHTVSPPDGWRVVARSLTALEESTELTNGTGWDARDCVVSVSLPSTDSFTPSDDAIRVRGRPGFYSESKTDRPQGGPYVAWRYSDDGWAWVHCDWLGTTWTPDPSRAELVALADGVRFRRSAVGLPFTVGRLPEGYRVQTVTVQTDGPTSVVLAAHQATTSDLPTSDVSVWLSVPADPRQRRVVDPERVTVGGRTAVLSKDPDLPTLCFEVQARHVCVSAYWPSDNGRRTGAVPGSATPSLTATAEAVRFVHDIDAAQAWIPAEQGLPR